MQIYIIIYWLSSPELIRCITLCNDDLSLHTKCQIMEENCSQNAASLWLCGQIYRVHIRVSLHCSVALLETRSTALRKGDTDTKTAGKKISVNLWLVLKWWLWRKRNQWYSWMGLKLLLKHCPTWSWIFSSCTYIDFLILESGILCLCLFSHSELNANVRLDTVLMSMLTCWCLSS